MVWICLFLIENILFKPVLLCYIYYICIKEMWRFWHPKHEVVKSLYRYPVKSCLGEDLQRAQLVQEGILGDRSHVVTRPWAVVQQHMKCFCMSDFLRSAMRWKRGRKICHQGRFGRSCADATWGTSLEHAGGADPRQHPANGDGASRWYFRGTLSGINVNRGKIWKIEGEAWTQ